MYSIVQLQYWKTVYCVRSVRELAEKIRLELEEKFLSDAELKYKLQAHLKSKCGRTLLWICIKVIKIKVFLLSPYLSIFTVFVCVSTSLGYLKTMPVIN